MLIREHGLIFVHIQKTGGNSIATALGQPLGRPEKHFLASELRSLYGEETWSRCFKFAIVRNPWSRLVSWYAMIDAQRPRFLRKRAGLNNFMTFVLDRAGSFAEFLENCDEEIVDADGRKWIYRNQLDYLSGADGALLVDFVGRFERLQEDFDHVARKVYGRPIPLPHVNRSGHAGYTAYFTPELAAKVAKRFERDIRAFGFVFGE